MISDTAGLVLAWRQFQISTGPAKPADLPLIQPYDYCAGRTSYFEMTFSYKPLDAGLNVLVRKYTLETIAAKIS